MMWSKMAMQQKTKNLSINCNKLKNLKTEKFRYELETRFELQTDEHSSPS